MNAKLHELIENQRKGHENEPQWMIGEQLLDLAAREPGVSEILERDLAIPELSLEAAEKKFQQYANKHRGSANSFCITPKVAEGILRDMYGLPGGSVREAPASDSPFLDLASFL
ncbi:MAG: hypothetical protein J5958_05545 [Clostridia bacterium]|nr:hypothetical protein [Clostridia bacterium]